MEALWKIEDKWNLTTQQAAVLFGCTAFALVGLCTATIVKRKRNQMGSHQAEPGGSNWVRLRRMLRWSDANKLKLDNKQIQLLGGSNSVWQRPILMGEKCQMPKFSGLILYDQTGTLLHHSFSSSHQEKSASGMRTMLKDLL